MSDLVVVYPTGRNVKDPGVGMPANACEVGWFVRIPERRCAFCKIGCCTQRLLYDMSPEPIVVHSMLGQA